MVGRYFSDDVIVQAVISGMLVALAIAGLVFTGLAVAVAVYVNGIIRQLRDRITTGVRQEARRDIRRLTASALNRLAYFEWQQSHLEILSEETRRRSLATAISDTERAYTELTAAGVTEDYSRLMATIRSNLAWFYMEANDGSKRAEAKEHARYAADQYAKFSEPEWLFTKARVLTVFASNREDLQEALWTYQLLLEQFGHLPGVAGRVAERRTLTEEGLKEFP